MGKTQRPGRGAVVAAASRRELLKAGGLGAALLGVGSAASGRATSVPPARTVDVVVVGAGFAGLTAARELAKAGKSVVLLEANDRVGGRTKHGKIAGVDIDLGGMWVGPDQTELLALSEEYGVKRYVSPIVGQNITEINGVIKRGERDMPALSPESMQELERLIGLIGGLADTVPTAAPWKTPNAAELDAKTFQTWMEEITKDVEARLMLDALAAAVLAADRGAFSALFFLFYMKSGKDIVSMMSIGEGAQKWLYYGGVHQIARRMAAGLGERVVLNTPVERIEQDELGVTVTSAAGSWKAKQAIVAMSPSMCSRIHYSPPLPPARDKLTQRYPMGSVIKFWVAYRRPFWRDQGLNGYTFSDRSSMSLTFDATPDGAGVGLMAGFFEGQNAVEWSEKGVEARKAFVISEIARLYGPEGANAIDYVDNDWPAEQWSRGCYAGNATPGTLSIFGQALSAPVGRIHWSGSETSPVYYGYIDGAVRAGKRAAADVAALL